MERTPNVATKVIEGNGTLLLQGTADVFGAAELHQTALALLARGEDAVVDCHGLEHVDGSTLQVLLALRTGMRTKGKKLRMEGVSARIEKIVQIAGLSDLLQA